MNNYSNPMVTYDEIVDALRAIIDCSKANGYLEEYGFLNVKYDSLNQNPIQKEQEQALLRALQALEKTLNAANKVIRENLEKELAEISASNIFMISSRYEHSSEKRKLASQNDLVMKLKEMSLPLDILSKVEQPAVEEFEIIEELPNGFEEITEEIPTVEPEVEEVVLEQPIVEEEPVEEEVIEEEPTIEYQPLVDEDIKIEEPVSSEETIEVESNAEISPAEDSFEAAAVEEEVILEQPIVEEEPVEEEPEKIQLIRKALAKAREKGNEQLVKVLEFQLNRELKSLK